jgi:hypothetical protein
VAKNRKFPEKYNVRGFFPVKNVLKLKLLNLSIDYEMPFIAPGTVAAQGYLSPPSLKNNLTYEIKSPCPVCFDSHACPCAGILRNLHRG